MAQPLKNIAAKVFPRLSPRALDVLIRREVRAAVGMNGDGEAKHRHVVRRVARQLDAALIWPGTPAGLLAEALDGPALELLIGAMVKAVYEEIRERVDGE